MTGVGKYVLRRNKMNRVRIKLTKILEKLSKKGGYRVIQEKACG